MGNQNRDEYVTVDAAAGMIGIRADVLRCHIGVGALVAPDGFLSISSVREIAEQKKKYMSLREFLSGYDSEKFQSRLAENRAKYIDYLEENDYFGITITEPDRIFFRIPGRDEFYIARDDAAFLDSKSRTFFNEYGVSEREKALRILNNAKNREAMVKYVRKYLVFIEDRKNIYTPSLTDFVRIVLKMPDIQYITDDDIIAAVEETAKGKERIIGFFAFVSRYEDVAYHRVKLRRKEHGDCAAYAYEDYTLLAKALFNAAYDRAHNLTCKALENNWYAEMWMFLACHYICGWRASDICDRWAYLNLESGDNPFGVHTDTLKDDILNERILKDVYDNVALYVIRRIEMAGNVPRKTGRGKLRSEITPELRTFFGKLTLIAECHHIQSGEGYMKSRRIHYYSNWIACRDFFGEEVYSITGMRNISSRRLNKSYLQGLEKAARNNGNTTLVSHVIASYARNHADVDTTAIYLRDHGLTSESAGAVLFMMMQRGVFGVSLYRALLTAYPETFRKLTAAEQSALMEKIPISAYELETAGNVFLAAGEMSENLARGGSDESKEILRAMFSVIQGQGKAKDEGVFCWKRALGLCCEHPSYESCVANLCPQHIFTSDGVPALTRVIRDYMEKFRATGNRKYEIALKNYIIPAFQETLNAVIRDMSGAERNAVKKMIGESL